MIIPTPAFERAFAHVIMGKEGIYSNSQNDLGGETVYGISRTKNPSWEGWKLVDAIKHNSPDTATVIQKISNNKGLMNMIKDFYWLRYWLPVKGDDINSSVAETLFDIGVNQGVKSSVKYLQQSLNKLNRNQKDYANIEVDGDLGTMETIPALSTFLNTSFAGRNINKNVAVLLKLVHYFQIHRYMELTDRQESQEGFMYGWITNRT